MPILAKAHCYNDRWAFSITLENWRLIHISKDIIFLNYEQQIKKLKSEYGLIVDNKDFAIHALSTMSYYDLINGYQDVFIENDKYINNMSIEKLYSFHLFDKKFQNILFRQSVLIENMFKNRLAQIIASTMGVHQDKYLDPKHYHSYSKTDNNITFSKLKKDIENSYNKPLHYIHQPTRHYLEKYGHVPPWILFKNITFSSIINLYKLLKSREKSRITHEMIKKHEITYTEKVDFLTTSLDIIRKFRNQIAHNLRVVTYNSSPNRLAPKVVSKITPNILYSKSDIKRKIGIEDMYSMMLSIIILIDNPFLIKDFSNEILANISSQYNPTLQDEEIGIPESLFKDYSRITNLPIDLSKRLVTFNNKLK